MNVEFKHVWAITAHGESKYLEECICSIKEQTVKSKIIMCTATDNQLIRGLSEKYDIPLFVKKVGEDTVRDNWNYAYNMADGEWVTLAHQDDIYASDYVKILQKKVMGKKRASIFFSDYIPFGLNSKGAMRNKKIEKIICLPLSFSPFCKNRLIKCFALAFGNAICCPTVSLHKSFLGTDLFKNSNKNGIVSNLDWEMWIQLAKQKNEFVYSTKELLKYRIHDEQGSAEYMKNHERVKEDFICFQLIWPKCIAKLLMTFYKKAYDIY